MGLPIDSFSFNDWFNTLSTSFISLQFLAFVAVLAVLYFIFPKKARWSVLLVGSAAFYAITGLKSLIIVLLSTLVIYLCGIIIEGIDKTKKSQRKVWLFVGVLSLLAVLVFTKCYSLFKWQFSFIIPLGISYYTFSSIGYLADVYWNKDKAEKNYFKLALFLLFFPKILQGPIARHKTLAPQLNEGHSFDYTRVCFGIQLVLWGYFKKMVVADRLLVIVKEVYGSTSLYGGAIIFLGFLLSGVQLFCDFSGCMDIALGVSQIFGIELEQNFNHPFFARSASEFWQRWHMTLGIWFRDYIFMPVSRSESVKKISKFLGDKIGPAAKKNSIVLIATFFVWIATGLWHGTGLPYLLWGLYWYVLISSTMLLSNKYASLKKALHISDDSYMWKLFQMVRTYMLFCFGRLLTIPNDISITKEVLVKFFADARFWQLFDKTLFDLGLDRAELRIALVGLAIVWIVGILQTKFVIREKIAKWKLPFRAIAYVLLIVAIVIFGVYGPGTATANFAYANY